MEEIEPQQEAGSKTFQPRSEAFLVSPGEANKAPLLVRRRARVKRVVYIDKPLSLSGSSFWCMLMVALHYMIFAFLLLTGLYHNYSQPPIQLALIPSFTAACVSVFGILCIPLQANKYIRFLLRPSSGLLISVAAMIGAGVWSALLYGPLHNNFSQAFQYLETAASGVLYLLLVYRRLKFADSTFSAGAESLLKVRSIFVRACAHALVLLMYIVLWSLCYINLVEVEDVSPSSNVTQSSNPFPRWSTGGGNYVSFGSPSLWVAKTFLLYNLYSVTMTFSNFFGLTFDEGERKNFVRKSRELWDLFDRTGMKDVVNSDLLFGVRIMNLLFLGTACSIAGTLLVQISGYPFLVAERIGWFCFITGIAAGNWALECAEMWACSLFVEFAQEPSSVYISNPQFASDVFEVLFGTGAQKRSQFPHDNVENDVLSSDRSSAGDGKE
ncbi:hypothetical protein GUITHDRAFT_101174 [Guillardia theta CCMP2712]|uniref:Uncharacterized protein n=1 Tax=Guillardia theta (strain CCMP2712) TaxID=905079 RepID=L1JZE1_GUITC|nr:hypothetical protein GUITHDRAFT_101174 [Guillardia theta CCMP2712]EKX53473.1 hypothetical protein GUITHDRAFT_101174 [Guillardia theta CCMP2712]|eukprot:XP_005840453.1 hypothetical protein GUITHDRAFT_101174 [Guillardia theta CCMP2712]